MCDGSCFEVPKTTRTNERKQKQTPPVKASKIVFSKCLAVAPCLFGPVTVPAEGRQLEIAKNAYTSAQFPRNYFFEKKRTTP